MVEKVQLAAKTSKAKENSASTTPKIESPQSMSSPVDQVLYLQRTIGNQAVQRLIKSGALQAKLKIGQPGDKYEQEADRVADAMMWIPELGEKEEETLQSKQLAGQITPMVQSQVELEEEEELQTKITSGYISEANPNLESNIQSLKEGGQPLSENDRAFLEPRFNTEFSAVRIHNDHHAHELSRSVNAQAFTVGRNIVFGAGHYAPETGRGRHLIAHELTHVVQQGGVHQGEHAKSRMAKVSDPIGAARLAFKKKAEKQQAHGTYAVEPNNRYRFNSEDVKGWSDSFRMVFHAHFQTVYTSAGVDIERTCHDYIKNKQVCGNIAAETAAKPSVTFNIYPKLDRAISAWMRENHPNIARGKAARATYWLGSKGQAGGGTGGGGGATGSAPSPKKVEKIENHLVGLPPSIKEEDRNALLDLIRELIGQADPNKPPPDSLPEMDISDCALELLLQIAKHPQRKAIVSLLKGSGIGEKSGVTLEAVLEIAIAKTDLKQAEAELGLELSKSGEAPDVIEKRPVRGEIINLSDRPVPGKPCNFEFRVKDDRDALRVPHISIQWAMHAEGKPKELKAKQVTNYIPLKGQTPLFNDRYFDFTSDESGIYVVHAFVTHNFFLSAHFTQRVHVMTEPGLLKEKLGEAQKGFAKPGTEKTETHVYQTGGLQVLQTGEITRGELEPGFNVVTIEDRIKQSGNERKQVEELLKTYRKLNDPKSKAIVEWAKTYLKTLDETKGRLEKDKGASPLGVRGAFASRSEGVPSKALNLLAYFNAKTGEYHLVLNDFTQVAEQENYRFEQDGTTVEQASEHVFLDQAEAYPPGSLSVTFQTFDESTKKPTDKYITFTKVTDNLGKTIKHAVFLTAVDIAVNLVAAVMMVIPGLQPLGIAIAIGYNTAKTLSELEEANRRGTLTTGHMAIGVGQIALSVIPLAGRGAKLLTIAGKSFYAVEGVIHAGNILLITTQGMSEVEKLRNGVIKELAKVEGEIHALESVNPADPDLPAKKAKRDELKKKGQDATLEVFTELLATQAFMIIGEHLTMEYAARRFSIGELKGQGRFHHEEGAAPHYDYKEGKIVGDELKVSPADLDRLQRTDVYNKAIEGAVPDATERKKVVEAIGATPVEIRIGSDTTAAVRKEGKPVLKIAEGASPADIVAEAAKLKSLPPELGAKTAPPAKTPTTFENVTEKQARAEAAKEPLKKPPAPMEKPAEKPSTPAKTPAKKQPETKPRPQAGVEQAHERVKQKIKTEQTEINKHYEEILEVGKKVITLKKEALNMPRENPSRKKLIKQFQAAQTKLKELKARQEHRNFINRLNRATERKLKKALDAKTYERPSFREGIREKVWEYALKEGKGKVLSPSGKEIKPGDPWVMGHKPKYEFWKHQRSAAKRGISREQFIKEHNDSRQYRPEMPKDSESHFYEDKTGAYLGP